MFDGPATDGPATLEPDPAERRARLRLARSARIGPVTFHEALQHFGSARAACARLPVIAEAEVTREQEALERAGGRFLLTGDAGYPAALAALPDAPPVLSAIGDLALLGRPLLAVVGAREASLAGCRLAGEIAAGLGAAGFVIASGLARGIDAAAQQAEIARRGLLLSEPPWGVAPVARAFPRRNRIVSGLSAGVVVVEAASRSGSLITAQRAAEQGREVFVVPGSPADPRYAGSNSLIQDGANLACHANDILGVLDRPRPAPQVVEKPRQKPAEP